MRRTRSDARRVALLIGFAATVMCVTACGSTPGSPSAAGTTTPAVQTPGSSPGSAPSSSAVLPVSQPCSLLSSSDLERVGVSSQPTQDQVGVAPSCEMDNANDHIIVSVFPTDGLATFQATGAVQHKTIGSHQTIEETDSTGSCVIAIGVTATSSVDVTVTPDFKTDPCPTAMTVAELVEPKLP